MEYGYARISRAKQSIERQIRNIKAAFPNATIVQEVFTRTTLNRKEWNKLYNNISDSQYIRMYWRTRAELSGIRYSGDAA